MSPNVPPRHAFDDHLRRLRRAVADPPETDTTAGPVRCWATAACDWLHGLPQELAVWFREGGFDAYPPAARVKLRELSRRASGGFSPLFDDPDDVLVLIDEALAAAGDAAAGPPALTRADRCVLQILAGRPAAALLLVEMEQDANNPVSRKTASASLRRLAAAGLARNVGPRRGWQITPAGLTTATLLAPH
jgi:hypothetical protein